MTNLLLVVILILLFVVDWRIKEFHRWLNTEEENRNTLYPVFSKGAIKEQLASIRVENELLESQTAIVEELSKKENKKGEPFEPSEEFKRAIRQKFKQAVARDIEVEECNFMVEANIAVLNGEKIDSLFDEWEERFVVTRFERERKEVEKRYKEWEKYIKKGIKK